MTSPQPVGNDPRAQAKADRAYAKAMRPWYKKKRFLLPLVLVLLGVIIAVNSGGGGSTSTGASSATTASSGPPAFAGATANDIVAQGGDPVKTDTGITMTSTKLAKTKTPLGTLLCTTATYENGSDSPTTFNGAFDWKLQNPSGAILMNTYGGEGALQSGELAPGGRTSGNVCFKPDGGTPAGQYVVLLDPSFRFGSDRIAWLNKL